LANKVTERQQKQKAQAQTPQPPALVATTASATNATQPIKVTSTAISAFVNNPLMQHTPVKVGQTTIKPLHPQMAIEKKPITDSAPPPLAPLSGANVVTKDPSGRTLIIASAAAKRKLTIDEEQNKRLALDAAASSSSSNSSSAGKEETQVTPSKNAANLYADLAASILEDEDMDDVPPLAKSSQEQPQQQSQQQQQLQLIPAKVQPTQRQLVFPANSVVSPAPPPQLKLATTATIKTDQGLQTVPVILQPKSSMDATPAQQTQYVLATNQQGQTYLVAQQTQPTIPTSTQSAPPTLLVTQTPQQQTKTIIILQQPGGVSAANVAGTALQESQPATGGPGEGRGEAGVASGGILERSAAVPRTPGVSSLKTPAIGDSLTHFPPSSTKQHTIDAAGQDQWQAG